MNANATALDLSELTLAGVIETYSTEEILADYIAFFKVLNPDYDVERTEFDPVKILLENVAAREALLRARINNGFKAVLLAYAEKSDLDHIAALFGVRRMVTIIDGAEVTENDTRLKRRVMLAPDSWCVGGPRQAYIYHALSSSLDIHDAWAYAGTGGRIYVVLAPKPDGSLSDDVVGTLVDLFSGEEVTPLTDTVSVVRGQIEYYEVDAVLKMLKGPSPDLVVANALRSFEAWQLRKDALRRSVNRNALIASLGSEAIEDIVLNRPTENLPARDRVLYRPSSVNLIAEVLS